MKPPTIDAYLNWGRWVVHCASNECVSAARVQPMQAYSECQCADTDVCAHGPVCGTRARIRWQADPAAVELAVRRRPVQNRNWLPGQTLTDLHTENIAHGVT